MEILISERRERDRERLGTDTRIFRAHVNTRSLSHTIQHTRRMFVIVCVCASVLLLKRRAAAERVSLFTVFLHQTAACRLGKHQSKWLCSAVGSPATAGPLQDRLNQPTPAKVSTCGL